MRLMIDTNIVRGIGAGELDWMTLDRVRQRGVSIHLPEAVLTELSLQLVDQRLPWEHWQQAQRWLLEVLDHEEPILIGGPAGLHKFGLLSRHNRDREIAEQEDCLDAAWTILTAAAYRQQITEMTVKGPRLRAAYTLSRAFMGEKQQEVENGWVDSFNDLREAIEADNTGIIGQVLSEENNSRRSIAFDGLVAAYREKCDQGRPEQHTAPSLRLDAYLRVKALLHVRSWKPKEPYNSSKHRNDVFDLELLKYLAYPSVLCTEDTRLLSKVRDSGSWQMERVIGFSDLTNPSVLETLAHQNWPEPKEQR